MKLIAFIGLAAAYDMAPDRFDTDFEKKIADARLPKPNKFDGLIHAQNGKVYDPETGKEVALEEEFVMLGEPIGLVQQRIQAKREYNDGMTP